MLQAREDTNLDSREVESAEKGFGRSLNLLFEGDVSYADLLLFLTAIFLLARVCHILDSYEEIIPFSERTKHPRTTRPDLLTKWKMLPVYGKFDPTLKAMED